jgi:predicted nucleotidyltransferase
MNLSSAEREALQSFKSSVASIAGNNLVEMTLFGSRARREGTRESDLDVLVLLEEDDSLLRKKNNEENARSPFRTHRESIVYRAPQQVYRALPLGR